MNKYIKIYQDLLNNSFIDNDNLPTKEFKEYIDWTVAIEEKDKNNKIYRELKRKESVLQRKYDALPSDKDKITFSEWEIKFKKIIDPRFDKLLRQKTFGALNDENYIIKVNELKEELRSEYNNGIYGPNSSTTWMKKELAILSTKAQKILGLVNDNERTIKKKEKIKYKLFDLESMLLIYRDLEG